MHEKYNIIMVNLVWFVRIGISRDMRKNSDTGLYSSGKGERHGKAERIYY